MARNLRKFVNPKFVKTIDLPLLRRLFERQPGGRLASATLFDGEPAEVREQLLVLFQGPENSLPQGVVADLHNISELGTEHGMTLLLQRAERQNVVIGVEIGREEAGPALDPKHFALLAFLDHPSIFEAASDLLSLEVRSSLAEFVGAEENVAAQTDDDTKARFEAAAREVFRQDQRSDYCRVGWYDDDDELNVVVTHGAPVTLRPVIDGQAEGVISFRAAEHAVLSYDPTTGRLKVGGVALTRRAALAEIFADTMLGRQRFFAGPESQLLYTLAPVEQRGFGFQIDHAFDPGITRVDITEVQVERITTDAGSGDVRVMSSFLVKDPRRNALLALREIAPAGITYGPNRYRMGHLGFRLHLTNPGERPGRVTIKLKPPSQAVFKRHRYEGRIMELLRRNGFCHVRDAAEVAAAAE